MLVICDYATRYPEAIPLHSTDTSHIAEALMDVFSRVGIPSEILTDQGSNFTSQLLTELYRMLHIHPIRTSPYHPQTDGLVERFNQTLKSMLRKAATKEGRDWDKMIPFLLFAYREVPQSSTGFSPFELLYGRPVRGPLDTLRESWDSNSKSKESVVSYVLSIRDKLDTMRSLVTENMQDAQRKQKAWYDRNACQRQLSIGDQVLVLLPTDNNKLLAQWQGPYPIVQKTGPVDYCVDMYNHRKCKRVFHVNMLKKWYPVAQSEVVNLAEQVDECSPDEDFPSWQPTRDVPGVPRYGKELTTSQLADLNDLIRVFKDVFSTKPGKTNMIEHHIQTGDTKPIKLPPYRVPQALQAMVRQEIKDMLDLGIIEPSVSEWAAPIVPILKKDGSLRLCVDYRRLNAISQNNAYPMPRIDDLIDQLGRAQFLSTLDLTRGYWQVPMGKASCHKTAFVTPAGQFQFTVMPFGLSGAPSTFQRMMDLLTKDTNDFAAAYLDDLIIFSDTWEHHMQHLTLILQQLRKANLTVKPQKCQLGMAECVYLGHTVGRGVVRPEMSKVEAIQAFTQPTTKKQVRAFLGITGYYRKFIPNYSTLAAPLTDLTKKNRPTQVTWTPECDLAFHELKTYLCTSPVLNSPNFSKQFIVQTDASDRGVGAVLSQYSSDNQIHPVAYFSKKLLPREQRYSTIEKECLAVKLGIEAFRFYLMGRTFNVQTDHRALVWLDRLKDSNSRLSRWSLSLQQYHFTVTHRPGVNNGNADALSRCSQTSLTGEGGRNVID